MREVLALSAGVDSRVPHGMALLHGEKSLAFSCDIHSGIDVSVVVRGIPSVRGRHTCLPAYLLEQAAVLIHFALAHARVPASATRS